MPMTAHQPTQNPRVLFVANDVLGDSMAGPAIRIWELARVVSQHCPVTLAIPPLVLMRTPAPRPDFPAQVQICTHPAQLRQLAVAADVLVTLGIVPLAYPFLAQLGKPLVIDAYDPFLLADLAQGDSKPLTDRMARNLDYRRAHITQLLAADFILCASERQRDYLLGMLSVLGRVNPATHDQDPMLRRLIDVVPFGLPLTLPCHTRQVMKGIVPGIRAEDKVVLWGGGIWDWFDPLTAIDAMAQIAQRRSDVKLFFMGVRRPNPDMAPMAAVQATMARSQELGLTDRTVFFNSWVAYGDRQNYLLEADVGLSLHRDQVETRFAFRTRFLDYLWAGLPMVVTAGDVLSEEVDRRQLGRVVPVEDVTAVAEAILAVVDQPRSAYAAAMIQTAAHYHWQKVAEPLVRFCRHPVQAPDKVPPYPNSLSFDLQPPARRLPQKAWHALRIDGVSGLARQVTQYMRWRRGQRFK